MSTIRNLDEVNEELERRKWFRVSNLYTVVQALVCIGLYLSVAAIGLNLDSWFVWVLVWPLQAFLLAGFLGAAHDCAHRVHYAWPIANRIAGMCWGAATSVNFTLYKHFHLDHHQFVGTDKDTEPAGEFDSVSSYLRSLPTVHFFMTFWRMSIRALQGRYPHFIRNKSQCRDVLIDNAGLALWFISIVGCTIIWPMTILKSYWIPLLLFFPCVFIFSLPEHYGCEQSPNWRRNTRSVRSNRLVSYLYWNGNFHADHHMFPRLPSRYLPRLNRLLDGNFSFSSNSYLAFHIDLIRRLSSKHAGAALEKGVVKVLSPSERIHFNELLAQDSTEMEGDR